MCVIKPEIKWRCYKVGRWPLKCGAFMGGDKYQILFMSHPAVKTGVIIYDRQIAC